VANPTAPSDTTHLKLIIGDLVVTVAKLSAEVEALRTNQKAPKREQATA
jgi:outer membrane murein-binding lipoprotein Lpp